MKLLVAGDANIDFQMTGLASLPQTDKEVMCDGFSASIGGSSTICAAAYSSLGGQVEFCGLLGDDENGRLMERMLRRAGVGLDLLHFTGECATGVTVNLVFGSTRTQITYPGTLRLVDEADAVVRELGRFGHLHLGGLYPLERFLPRVTEVLEAARTAGVTTSLTTQWDPRQEWKHLADWLPLLSYLFVNEDEALSITRRTFVDDAWKDLAARTACPLITLGAAGAFASGHRVQGFSVPVRDTTGAGDSFAAGLLFATKEKHLPLEEAVRYGCAAGALCCTYTGGVSPELSDAHVAGLLS
jgi:sugar/nucleoside kinase (ribokinase family)